MACEGKHRRFFKAITPKGRFDQNRGCLQVYKVYLFAASMHDIDKYISLRLDTRTCAETNHPLFLMFKRDHHSLEPGYHAWR